MATAWQRLFDEKEGSMFDGLRKVAHFKILKSEARRANREGLEKLKAGIRELNGRYLKIEFYGKPFE
ncbi:MAG: hypothetical protein K2X93_00870 [Candidatus Obscuribacterales bacterium]|nr:hypothetical protein [Candidatus Obscuribacterales bacterium]